MAMNGDTLIQNVIKSKYVDLKDQLEDEIAQKIATKIKEKKVDILQKLSPNQDFVED